MPPNLVDRYITAIWTLLDEEKSNPELLDDFQPISLHVLDSLSDKYSFLLDDKLPTPRYKQLTSTLFGMTIKW